MNAKEIQSKMAKKFVLESENEIAVQKALKFLLKNALLREEVKEIVDSLAAQLDKLHNQINSASKKDKTLAETGLEKSYSELLKKYTDIDEKININDSNIRSAYTVLSTNIQKKLSEMSEVIENRSRINLGALSQAESDIRATISNAVLEIERVLDLLSVDNIRNALESIDPVADRLDAKAIRVQVDAKSGKPLYESLEVTLKRLIKEVKNVRDSLNISAGVAAHNAPRHQEFEVNTSTTDITLNHGIGAQGTAVWVRYQGKMLDYGTHYTVSGNKITFIFTDEFYFYDGTVISVTYWS